MQNIPSTFLEYIRLERKRIGGGLTVSELERWSALKRQLDRRMRKQEGGRPERRACPRVPTRLHCSFASRSDFDDAVITNLSAGGVFIATASPLPIGAKLVLLLHVASTGASIEVEAIVVTTNVGPGLDPAAAGMGVRFSRVDPETIQQIYELYEAELAREIESQEEFPRPCSLDRRSPEHAGASE